ncbi:MAG: hypothetical protein ACKOUS_14840, partial [Alphaproteobacteria bacterium]
MSDEKAAGPVPAAPAARADRWILAAAAVVVGVLAIGMFGAFRIVAVERERDQRSLALRLGSTADARAGAVGDWLMRQGEAAKGLAENQTIQLFLTELAMAGGDRGQMTDEASQSTYVRSLLSVAAERLGYVAQRTGVAVNANLQRSANAGIGFTVLDPGLRPLLSTAEPPVLEGRLLALAEEDADRRRAGLALDRRDRRRGDEESAPAGSRHHVADRPLERGLGQREQPALEDRGLRGR